MTAGVGMADLILERDTERDVICAARARAEAGGGSLVLVEGPQGIGKTTLLAAEIETAVSRPEALSESRPEATSARVLSARGRAPERGFAFGIVRQLFEPVRAACGPEEWAGLVDGAANLARRVFDGGAALETSTEPHATTHGLYWLAANLAARRPLLITVDDLHWADTPSLRWLSHLAARIEDLPAALLITVRSGPDRPGFVDELRALPHCARLTPRPLSEAAVAAGVRALLKATGEEQTLDELCAACHERTRGNPFLVETLLESLAALRDERGPGVPLTVADVLAAGPGPIAEVTLRRAGELGAGAEGLLRAVAVLGDGAPLRHAAALAGQDIPRAARLADSLREAFVLAPGVLAEFAQPVVRTAVYESVPPCERALAHARASQLLEADGADAERVALHLLRSLPVGDPRAVEALLAAARAASDRGAPDTAAGYLRRALDEPPVAGARARVLLEYGLALARFRDPVAVGVLRDAAARAAPATMASVGAAPADIADAALASVGMLGIWGHHDSAQDICGGTLDALGAAGTLDTVTENRLEAALFAESWLNAPSAARAWRAWRTWSAAGDGADADVWRVFDALSATISGAGRPAPELRRLRRALDAGLEPVESSAPGVVTGLLVLTWNDEFGAALRVCDKLLADARTHGCMNLIAAMSCVRSAISRRLGNLRDAATEARYGLDFEFKTAPPLAVAWGATYLIDALLRLGRVEEAEEVAEATAARRPADGWLETTLFVQSRGALRVAQRRYEEALDDLLRAGDACRALGIVHPSPAWWRDAAVTAYRALDRQDEAAALAAEQLELARRAGTQSVLGMALRCAAPFGESPADMLGEAVLLLDEAGASFDAAWALADLGAHLRRAGRRSDAQQHLRRALDFAERSGATPLRAYARQELLAAGARPRRTALTGPDALTGAERQVAALAVDGLSNRQIAAHLFITRATVETHLRHAFHKLGISSRTDLRGCL